jgi:hypothetical protein
MKTSKVGAYLIALKYKDSSLMSDAVRAGGARSLTDEKVLTANKEIVEESSKSSNKKSMLSEMGDKLCLSKWSAFK